MTEERGVVNIEDYCFTVPIALFAIHNIRVVDIQSERRVNEW